MTQQNETKPKPAEPEYQVIVEAIRVPLPGGSWYWQRREYLVQRRR